MKRASLCADCYIDSIGRFVVNDKDSSLLFDVDSVTDSAFFKKNEVNPQELYILSKYGKDFYKLAPLISNKRLSLTIMPTEKCNFRCSYCYENHKGPVMSKQTINAIKKLIYSRIGELKCIETAWFGGEPLLELDTISQINSYIQTLCADRKDILFASDITTNGYLMDKKVFCKLLSLGIKYYQISLDGPRELHDTTRIMANGKGTFDRIWGNLLSTRLCNEEFKILLRVHFHPENVSYLKRLLYDIQEHFGNDKRYQVSLKGIAQLGGSCPTDMKVFQNEEDQAKIVAELLNGVDLNVFNYKSTPICYACNINSYVIRSNGFLAKCTAALYNDKNCIGKINEDGNLVIQNEKLLPWIKKMLDMRFDVLKCPYKYLSLD